MIYTLYKSKIDLKYVGVLDDMDDDHQYSKLYKIGASLDDLNLEP